MDWCWLHPCWMNWCGVDKLATGNKFIFLFFLEFLKKLIQNLNGVGVAHCIRVGCFRKNKKGFLEIYLFIFRKKSSVKVVFVSMVRRRYDGVHEFGFSLYPL
jgi:hypothetical protein